MQKRNGLSNDKLLKVNLQLFAEDNEDLSDDNQELEEFSEEDFALDDTESVEDVEEEVVEPQTDEDVYRQTPEENAQFKKIRLKAEADAKKKFEAERAEFERQKQEFEESQAEKKIRDEYLSQQKIWDKADEEGVSEETAKKMLELEVEKVIQGERTKVKERFEALQAQKSRYQNDPYFVEVNAKVEEAMRQNPNLDYDTPYKYFYYDKMRELDQTKEKNTVKRTLANVQDGMRRRPVPSSAGDSGEVQGVLSNEGREMANAFGLDARKVAKRVASKLKQK